MTDNVNSPKHYQQGVVETIYTIRDTLGAEGFKAYCMGNWIKYNARYQHKNGEEDLRKAEVYLGWAVNGLPEPVNGMLPPANPTLPTAKFRVGDKIRQIVNPNEVWEVVEITEYAATGIGAYVLETDACKTYLPVHRQDAWELVE